MGITKKERSRSNVMDIPNFSFGVHHVQLYGTVVLRKISLLFVSNIGTRRTQHLFYCKHNKIE